MRKDKVIKLIPVMQAFLDGKSIQFCTYADDIWKIFSGDSPAFGGQDIEWRIKPEPFECWMNVYPDDTNDEDESRYGYISEEKANTYCQLSGRTIHMREVT